MPHEASALVQFGIPGLAFAVAAMFLFGARRYGGATPSARRAPWAVLAVFLSSGLLSESGVLANANVRPHPFMPLMLASVVLAVVTARSELGRRIAVTAPLWALVGSQAFRLPLELVMRSAAEDGVMPVEMSFAGYNFDVVTGASALVLCVFLYLGHVPRAVVLAWNVVGSVLLAVIVGIAAAALPWVRAFGPDHVNSWVLHFPYVWLPTILVPAALFGHLVVFRRLLGDQPREENGHGGSASSRA